MTRYTLRLDPWAAEYDGAVQAFDTEADGPADAVDVTVETGEWRAMAPPAAPPPPTLAFVDGVRRVEHRLLVEEGGRTLFGLLGSFAVGATVVEGRARVAREHVGRVACVGGGLLVEPLVARLAAGGGAGRGEVRFEPETVPENTPVAPVQGLQNAMRRREALLAEATATEAGLVVLDGPLTFLAGTARPVVGFVKRLLKPYLPAPEAGLLKRLVAGERTPLFLVQAQTPRYSWYVRLAAGRAIHSPLAGIARLEASAAVGLTEARRLADVTARELPRFASSAARDPRAPQNLYPIGGLEAALRHLLGDALVVRRAVEARLHEEAVA